MVRHLARAAAPEAKTPPFVPAYRDKRASLSATIVLATLASRGDRRRKQNVFTREEGTADGLHQHHGVAADE